MITHLSLNLWMRRQGSRKRRGMWEKSVFIVFSKIKELGFSNLQELLSIFPIIPLPTIGPRRNSLLIIRNCFYFYWAFLDTKVSLFQQGPIKIYWCNSSCKEKCFWTFETQIQNNSTIRICCVRPLGNHITHRIIVLRHNLAINSWTFT